MATVNLPLDLFDGDGFLWDIQGDGRIDNGTIDAYDDGLRIVNFPFQSQGETEDNDREVAIGPSTASSNSNIEILRKIYVPDDQGWARFLTTVTNTGTTATTYNLSFFTDLGSDGSTQIIGTSSGDTIFDVNDDWLVTDDSSNGGGDPTLIHVVSGAGGINPTTASVFSSDDIEFSYDLDLAPGESKTVMVFASQNQDQATALAKAPVLTDLEIGALDGMSDEELGSLVNFVTEGLFIDNAIVTEGNNGTTNVNLTVTLNRGTNNQNQVVTVDYATADGTATVADDDYISTSGSLTFQPNETTKTITVQVVGDENQELDETFSVNLSNATNSTIAANGTGIVTIDNDDFNVDVELSLLVDVSGSVSSSEYELQIAGYAEAFDNPDLYNNVLSTGVLGQVAVNMVLWSSDDEQEESVTWTLIDSVEASQAFAQTIRETLLPSFGGTRPFGGSTATGTAIDFAVPLFFNNEFEGAHLTIDISGDGDSNDGIAPSTARDNALAAGIDAINGLVISNNPLQFYEDNIIGGINANGLPAFVFATEDFFSFGEAIAEKIETELTPPPLIDIDDVSLVEGDNGVTNFVFTISITQENEVDVSVDYATFSASATEGTDYIGIDGTVVFAPGETSKTITVEVQGDQLVELDETFFVNLSNSVNSDIRDGQGIGTIINDDTANFSIDSVTQLEGDSGSNDYVFTVTLDNNIDTNLTVDFATIDDTAFTSDSDYVANNGTLNFAGNAGETQTITVSVNGDTKVELDETFLVDLSNINASGRDVNFTNNQGIGIIQNDDGASLSISDVVTQVEGDSGNTDFVFTVTLDNQVDTGVNVDFATSDGTALISDNDYLANSGTLNFAGNAGETQTITVSVDGDTKVELDEDFFLDLSNINASGRDVNFTNNQGIGIIQNDDGANLSISDVTQEEGDSGNTDFVFTVTLDNDVDTGVNVDFATSDGTALISDNDYVANNGTLNFAGNAGETQTITVSVDGDTKVELDEDFFLDLSNINTSGRNVNFTNNQGIGIIQNDDGASLSISDVTQEEGDSGNTDFVFTVTLDNDVDTGVNVDFATSDGTALISDNDYVTNNGTLNFAGNAGETQTITVSVDGDTKVELDENFFLDLTNIDVSGRNVNFSNSQGTGTIVNDDSASFSIDDVSQLEGDSGNTDFVFTVTLDSEVDTAVDVDFATSDGTALTSNSDYLANNGTLNFTGSAGETQAVTVSVIGDIDVEADETFLVDLANINANARDVTFVDSTGTGTIENDDQPIGEAFLFISDATVDEDSGNLDFQVTLNGSRDPFTVDYTTNDGTALTSDNDYTANNGTLNFSGTDGETLTISVPVIADSKVELDETLTVLLSNVVGSGNVPTISDDTGLGTIVNDDLASLSINDVSQLEGDSGNTDFVFTVTLDNDVDTNVNVDFNTSDSTALISDNDYVTNSGTLNFTGNAGETQNLTVSVVGDANFEPDEDFLVNLSNIDGNGRNVNFLDPTGTGTIENDDEAPSEATLSIDDVSINEDSGNLEFTVTLNGSTDAFTVDFTTSDGTALTSDNDYTANNGTLNFSGTDGETLTISVPVIADSKVELDETLTVLLSNVVGTGNVPTISDDSGLGTIVNDDLASLSINDVSQLEGDSGNTDFVFTVTLDNDVDTNVNVDFDTSDGTALLSDNDYLANNGNLSFTGSAGETQTVTVSVVGDTDLEADETFLVDLSNISANGRSVNFTDSTGTGTIENDDQPIEDAILSVNNPTIDEDSGFLLFTITLTGSTDPFAINYTTADDTALVSDNDYIEKFGGLNFNGNDGETANVSIDVTPDAKVELDETLNFIINDVIGSGTIPIVANNGVGTIVNDDSASFSIDDVTELEGDSGNTDFVFTVTLDNEVDTNVSVDFNTSDGSALISDNDYLANSGTLNFTGSAGETETVTVSVVGDTTFEADEDFSVNLSNIDANGRNVNFSDSTGTGTIQNDDPPSNDIFGTPARDILTGNENDNTIIGFEGGDRITTGGGNDTLIYQSFRDLGDTITDFEVGSDQFDFSQLLQSVGYVGADPIADDYLSFASFGSTSVVLFDQDGSGTNRAYPFIFAENTTVSQLSDSNNFIF